MFYRLPAYCAGLVLLETTQMAMDPDCSRHALLCLGRSRTDVVSRPMELSCLHDCPFPLYGPQ